MGTDLLVSLRSLARHKVSSLVILLTLTVGVGALGAAWSAVDSVLLAPLPFEEPEQLVRVHMHPLHSADLEWESSVPAMRALRRQARSLDGLEGWGTTSGRLVVRLDDGLDRIEGQLVTAGFFDLLGVDPLLGRSFADADDVPGSAPVVLVSESLWRSRFGSDSAILGRTLEVEGEAREIVGVMPRNADLPVGAELWIPVGSAVPPQFLEMPQVAFVNLVGRLADDATPRAAEKEMDAILARVIHPQIDAAKASRTRVSSLAADLREPLRVPSLALLGAALLVLLTGAANVGGLLAVRALRRRGELAVRVGLGAEWRHLARLAVLETGVLAVAGGAGGLLLAPRLLDLLLARFPNSLFLSDAIRVDVSATLLAGGVSVGLGVLFGLGLAAWARRIDAAEALRPGGTRGVATSTSHPFLRLLVASQIATAVLVALAAGLLLRSVHGLADADPGFAKDGVLTFQVPLPPEVAGDVAEKNQLHRAMLDELASLPGVEAAGGTLMRPLHAPVGLDVQMTVEGRAGDQPEDGPLVNLVPASKGGFDALGLRLVEGHGFSGLETADSLGVVVLTRTLAQRHFPGDSPVGRRIKWGGPESDQPWLVVSGVVDDVRWRSIEEATPTAFVPFEQAGGWGLDHFAVRTAGNPWLHLEAVRDVVARHVPGSEPLDVATMGQMVDRALAGRTFVASLVGSLAATSLVLVALGLYGLLAFLVALRTSEIGIRMALGATPGDVVAGILTESGRIAALGVAAGLALAVAAVVVLGKSLAPHLAGLSLLDPWTFAAVPLLVAALAVVAGGLPARRAAIHDPAVALRESGS